MLNSSSEKRTVECCELGKCINSKLDWFHVNGTNKLCNGTTLSPKPLIIFILFFLILTKEGVLYFDEYITVH